MTPPSEPLPPATAVFNGWSSFKKSLRPRPLDGGAEGDSEYTTDEEGAGDPSRWSTLSNKSSTAGAPMCLCLFSVLCEPQGIRV